jgi:hypothetical protein
VFADVADVTPQPHDFDQAAQWLLRHRRRANEGHLYRPLLKLAQMFWTGTGVLEAEKEWQESMSSIKCRSVRTLRLRSPRISLT